jgi:hypothetical protein
MSNFPYTGIGSRKTPQDVLELMTYIARRLDADGWVLRSGGAPGADTAFAAGSSRREVFLPWPGFGTELCPVLARPSPEAFNLAARHHPTWTKLSSGARALLARDGHQVLGQGLDDPSRFVLCWTPDGATEHTTRETGGTGQAIRVAVAHSVPVYNLARDDHRRLWHSLVEEY